HVDGPHSHTFYARQSFYDSGVFHFGETLELDLAIAREARQLADIQGLLLRQPQRPHLLRAQFQDRLGRHGIRFCRFRHPLEDGQRGLPAKLLIDNRPHQGLEYRFPVFHPVRSGFANDGGQHRIGLFQMMNCLSHGTQSDSQTSYIVSMQFPTVLAASLAVLLGSIGVAVALTQDQAIRVDVNLVSILASVRSKSGALISNLEKGDFRIYEDGKEQQIRSFTRETDLPLTIGLLVDTSSSQERLIETEQRAASQFFSKVIREKDQAFLIQFGAEAELRGGALFGFDKALLAG